jgi:hypothetical protein
MEKELTDLVQDLDNVASGGGGGKGIPHILCTLLGKKMRESPNRAKNKDIHC